MRFFIAKKNSFLFIIFILIFGCNYEPLLNENQLGQLKFKIVETSGDKRIAQIIVNKLNIRKDRAGNFALFVDAKKNVRISNKSVTGKVLEYNITLSYQLELRNNLTGNIIYSKKIINTENYNSSNMYSDTISSEKKIIENISSLAAKQILNEINLALKNDI